MVHIFGLPFLYLEEVGERFINYFIVDKPEHSAIIEFRDSLIDNYISNDSIFPPKMWAQHSSIRIFTTNACEIFHSDFNSNFYHQNPHIFKIIEILKLFRVNRYIKIRTVNSNSNKNTNICKKYADK